MAKDTFQPILNQSSASTVPQQAVQGVDLRGAASVLGALGTASAKGKEAEQEMGAAIDLTLLQRGLINLHTEREQGNIAQQEALASVQDLQADNIPDAEQAADFKRVQSQLDNLKAFKRQGLGNDSVFRVRANAMLNQAQLANPLISKEVMKLFNGEVSDPQTSAGATENAAFVNMMDQRFGRGWTTKEVGKWKQEQAIINNYKNNAELGTYTAASLQVAVPGVVSAYMGEWRDTAVRALGAGGILGVEEKTLLENDLMTRKQLAQQELNNNIHMAMANGQPLTQAHISSLQSSLDGEFKIYEDMLTGKDLATKLKMFNEVEAEMYKFQSPALLKHFHNIAGSGGAMDIQDFFTAISNDKLKTILGADYAPYLRMIDGDTDKAIAQSIDFMMNEIEITDPGMRDIAATVAASMVAGNPDTNPKIKGAVIDSINASTKDDNGLIIPGNVVDSADALLNRSFGRNLVKDLPKEDLDTLKITLGNWAKDSVTGAISGLERQPVANLEYNPQTKKFTSQLRKSVTGGRLGVMSTDLMDQAELLNKILELSDAPALQGIAMPREQILAQFNKMRVAAEKDNKFKEDEE